MLNIGKIQDGDLLLYGEINERESGITSGLVSSFPFDATVEKYIPNRIRYIRDWANGNSINNINTWIEIEARDFDGVNVALNKTVSSNRNVINSKPLSSIVDGSYDINSYVVLANNASEPAYVQVDLGDLYSINIVKICRYAADNRIFYNTKVEISQDALDWYSIYDSAIEGEYSESSDGKSINFNNLGPTLKPVTNNNTILNYDGVIVQSGTTNLIPSNKNQFSGWTSGNAAAVTITNNQFVREWSTQYASRIQTVGGSDFVKLNLDVVLTTSLNVDYTTQVKVKNIGIYPVIVSDNINTPIAVNHAEVKELTFNSIGNGTSKVAIVFSSQNVSDNLDFIAFEPQVEVKKYASQFVNGTTLDSQLEIPFNLKPPFSLTFKHKSLQSISNITNVNFATIMQLGKVYSDNNTVSLINNGSNLALYAKGNTGTDWTSKNENLYSVDSNYWNNQEHHYTILCLQDNSTLKVYIDGKLAGAVSGSDQLNTISGGVISLGNPNMPNARYRDVFIYNRVLLDDEIKLLANGGLDISSDGDLTMREVVEGVLVPDDAIVYELTNSTYDVHGARKARVESNLAYEDNSVWIGNSSRNILFNSGTVNLDIAADINSHVTKTNLNSGYYLFQNNSSFQSIIRLSCNPADLVANKSYSAQVNFVENTGMISLKFGNSLLAIKRTEFNGKLSGTVNRVSYDLASSYLDVILEPNTSVILYNAQIEDSTFTTPFVTNTRAQSKLEFNFYNDLGLNWNRDWSIVYWKKAISTNIGDVTGYNVESLGCENNTVGRGYFAWGKFADSNSLKIKVDNTANDPIPYQPNTPIDPSIYFNNWHMISMIKNGTKITIKESFTNNDFSYTFDVGTIAPNYFVTQGGYDFQLGGWEDIIGINRVSNSFYRDLIVATRTFTDTELAEISRRQFKIEKDVFMVQRNFKEGAL